MNHLNRLIAAAGAIAVFTVTASAKVERTVERTFQVQPGVHLKVSTFGGDVRIESSTDSVVKVIAKEHIRASGDDEANEILKKLDLTIEQDGNEVSAKASYEGSGAMHFGSWPPVNVDFIVKVPTKASVDLKTSGGNIVVGDLDGPVKAHTSGGEIDLGTITGEIDASTSGGNVDLKHGLAKATLSTSGGNVTAERLSGPSDLRTSGGNIRIEAVESTLTADTSGGDVRASFEGPLKGDCSLSTSGGEVRATLDQSAGFHLRASTSGGEVKADGLTITIEHGGSGKSSLSGSVNGGGPDLELHTSGGDIEVSVRKGR